MQTNVRARVIASLFALAAGVAVNVQAQYSAFTYQGRLNDGGNPATGSYELQFTLYDRATAGTVLGDPITNTVAASDGVFTTTLAGHRRAARRQRPGFHNADAAPGADGDALCHRRLCV